METLNAVSYTHLDVYKRQELQITYNCNNTLPCTRTVIQQYSAY